MLTMYEPFEVHYLAECMTTSAAMCFMSYQMCERQSCRTRVLDLDSSRTRVRFLADLDLDLDSGGKDLDLDLNFEDLTTSLARGNSY